MLGTMPAGDWMAKGVDKKRTPRLGVFYELALLPIIARVTSMSSVTVSYTHLTLPTNREV